MGKHRNPAAQPPFTPKTPVIPLIFSGAAALLFTLEGLLRDSGHYVFPFVGEGGTFGLKHLRVFGIRIYYLMLILGGLAAFRTMWVRRRTYGLTDRQALQYPLVCLLLGVIGGYGFQMIMKGTFTVHSVSSIGGALAIALFTPPISIHLLKQDPWKIYDCLVLMGLSFIIVARTGCFMNGCCGAVPLHFQGRTVRLPVQLYEVFLLLSTQALLFDLERRKTPSGYIAITFGVFYAVIRFLLEFLRNIPKAWLGLTAVQFWLPAMLFTMIVACARSRTLQRPRGHFPLWKDGGT